MNGHNKTMRDIYRLLRHLEKLGFPGLFPFSLKEVFAAHFKAGLVWGAVYALGFTLVGAVAAVVLYRLSLSNLPLIGSVFAAFADTVVEKYQAGLKLGF